MELQNMRMLELLAEAIREKKVRNEKEWCEKIGIFQSNLKAIKDGSRSFTTAQLVAAVRFHGTTLDWIVGLTNTRARSKVGPDAASAITGAASSVALLF